MKIFVVKDTTTNYPAINLPLEKFLVRNETRNLHTINFEKQCQRHGSLYENRKVQIYREIYKPNSSIFINKIPQPTNINQLWPLRHPNFAKYITLKQNEVSNLYVIWGKSGYKALHWCGIKVYNNQLQKLASYHMILMLKLFIIACSEQDPK